MLNEEEFEALAPEELKKPKKKQNKQFKSAKRSTLLLSTLFFRIVAGLEKKVLAFNF